MSLNVLDPLLTEIDHTPAPAALTSLPWLRDQQETQDQYSGGRLPWSVTPVPNKTPAPETLFESPVPESPLKTTPAPKTRARKLSARPKKMTESAMRMSWTLSLERVLLRSLEDAVDNGERAQSGFKDSAWIVACREVKSSAPLEVQQACSIQTMKNKIDQLKRDYRIWLQLISQSGWTIDEETGCPSAEPAVMDAYFMVHPQAKKFATKPISHEDELESLFACTLATGEHSQTAEDSVFRTIEDDEMLDPESQRASTTGSSVSVSSAGELAASRKRATERIAKNTKGKRLKGTNLEILAELVVQLKQANEVAEDLRTRASSLLWSSFSDVPVADKRVAARALRDEDEARDFITSPLEVQRLMVMQWIEQFSK